MLQPCGELLPNIGELIQNTLDPRTQIPGSSKDIKSQEGSEFKGEKEKGFLGSVKWKLHKRNGLEMIQQLLKMVKHRNKDLTPEP